MRGWGKSRLRAASHISDPLPLAPPSPTLRLQESESFLLPQLFSPQRTLFPIFLLWVCLSRPLKWPLPITFSLFCLYTGPCPLSRRSFSVSVCPSLPLPLLWISSFNCLDFSFPALYPMHFHSLHLSLLFSSQKARSHLGWGEGSLEDRMDPA